MVQGSAAGGATTAIISLGSTTGGKRNKYLYSTGVMGLTNAPTEASYLGSAFGCGTVGVTK